MSVDTEMIARPSVRFARGTAAGWGVLAATGAVAWLVTVDRARSMGSGPGTMGMAFPLFVGMWVAMTGAMMLPAIGPQASDELAPRGGRRVWAERMTGSLAFGAGFLAPWAVYGLLAFAALLGTGRLADASPSAAKWLGVGIFAVAGVYQFTPAKRWALDHCRMAMSPHGGGNLPSAFLGGARDGAICVGCCWALMTILFALGVMNLAAMAGLAAVIFAEKILPRPNLVAGLAGIAFLGLAAVAAFHPSVLSGLHVTDMGVHMAGL